MIALLVGIAAALLGLGALGLRGCLRAASKPRPAQVSVMSQARVDDFAEMTGIRLVDRPDIAEEKDRAIAS